MSLDSANALPLCARPESVLAADIAAERLPHGSQLPAEEGLI